MTTTAERVLLGSEMANWAYKPGNPPPVGWTVVEPVDGKGTGLDAVILKNTVTGNYYFAIAGTNEGTDVAKWPSAITGYGGNKAQIDVALDAMTTLNTLAQSTGNTVSIGGHSLAGQFVDIGSYVFGWQGVKFDAVGASSVISSAGFTSTLGSMGITPVGAGDVISCNINGVAFFGGGLVGNVGGQDIPGTTNCRVELPTSTASGIVNGLATIVSGPVGYIVSRAILGGLQHDMTGIEQAVQAGAFTVDGIKPQAYAPAQAYSFTDEDGNILRTVQGSDGKPVLDGYGQPKLELVMAPPTTGIGGEVIQFDSRGHVLSATNDMTPTAQNGTETNLYSLTNTTSAAAVSATTPDSTSSGPSGANNSVLANPDYSVSVNYSLLGDVNTASGNAAVANYAISDGLRPGNSNLGLNLNAATGLGLQPPASAADSSLYGSSLNNAASSNFNLIPTDPLVLDLNGDGVRLTNYTDAPVLFDADNDGGSLEQTGWVSNADGILVHDLNGDGKINNISETLSEYYNGVAGSAGMAGTKPYANGFAALKSLDSNADNQFTSADSAWSQLRVWVDANHDGKTDAGELKTFADLGITAINLASTAQSGEVRDGNAVLARGTFTQTVGGTATTREAIAANFLANPAGSTVTASGSGIIVATESVATGSTTTSASSAFVSQNTNASVAETLDAVTLGVKNLTGGAGNDTLTGDTQANWLAGGLGADKLYGGAGDDVLLIDANDTVVDGGDGLDVAQVIGTAGVTLNMAQSHMEIAVGGDGNDVFIGGGRSTVFVRGGAGDDLIVGGAANDVLSGEDGADTIDGGAGNDLIRGHRGQDTLLGGAGDDVLDGGLEDDRLSGGAGSDVLVGGRGDDTLDGGDGIDVAEYTGSYADYRITKLQDVNGATTFRVVDTRTGQDGADTLTGIEKLSFSDVSGVDLSLGSPLPVKDVLAMNSSGAALSRTAAHLLSKTQLLANDRDWDSDTSQLSITAVSDAKGGTVSLTASGDVLFTPDASYTGVMGFKYKVQDAQGNFSQVTNSATGQSEPMQAAVYLQTSDLPTDPLAVEQWYLADTNVFAAWGTAAEQAAGQGYSGKGVKIAQFEPGGAYSTGPEVFDYRHPDLQQNADKNWLNTLDAQGNNATPQTFSDHATMVAGVMVAARNGQGGVGVAYNASLAGQYIQGEGLEVDALSAEITNALAKFKNYDVVNNSWGATANFDINVTPVGLLETGILDAITNGRGGLGTAIVMAGGNDRATGANTNTNALTANRAVITTGSINAPGDLGTLQLGSKPFSNPGASILVSAPGSNIDSTSRELVADNGSTFGSQYDTSQGTSFAAPIVSGIIALMLEANPTLGYRDIQTILAMSATKVDDPNGTDWTYNTAKNWNGGGMHASHDYGFGKVDARAAVRLAETWYDTSTAANEQSTTGSSGLINAVIPDGAGVLSRTLSMAAGLEVESAQVTLELNHQRWGDLIIKLISPTGTESILVNRPGKAPGSGTGDVGDTSSGPLSFSFNTTHVRGETSGGTWTLQVIDAATGSTGTLTNWKLDLYGATADSNDVYVYTNEFASTTGRTALTDGNGGVDIVNVSAVTGNSTVNLNDGTTSTIAGKTLTLNGGIEKVFAGDGNDTLVGNALTNVLLGGRGNDTINGGAGTDRLQGGRGSDTLTGGSERDWFVVDKDAGSTDTITDFNPAEIGEKIALVGFENVTDFSQVVVTQEGSNTRLGLGNGQSVLLLNLAPSAISEQNFVFTSDSASLETYLTYATKVLAYGTAGVDNALLPNTSGDLAMYALGGDDVLGSQTTNDLIDGGDGNDTLWGDYPGYSPVPGSDWLEGGAGNDVLNGGAGNDRLVGGSGNDQLLGEDGNDALLGNTGVDYLFGGAGDDLITLDGDIGTVAGTVFNYYGTREGGAGADVFKVLSTGGGSSGFSASGTQFSASNLIADFDPNQVGEKIDVSAFTWITRVSDLNIQNLTVNGVQYSRISTSNGSQSLNLNIRGVAPSQLNASHFVFAPTTPGAIAGTTSSDTLTGDAGANTLNGLAGADTMTGRTGDDTYVVDNAGDTINELPGGGYDAVQASVGYTLSSNVEMLTLTGTANLNATGNAQRNRLVGNAGNNRLDGGAEADAMVGGAGNDTYVVDNQLDTALENTAEGTDTVESSVSWTLGSNFEHLTLTGTNGVNATGNDLANTLTGNASGNILDGAQGADTLVGGLGNDTYYVDNAGDIVTEALDAGIDTVYSSIDLTLAANVENAVLFGGATTLTGNALDNTLLGNGLANTLAGGAGNDVLDGAAGADSMLGGAGDDTYFVDNAGDSVTELASEGVDTVVSGLATTLGANVENLVLTGVGNLGGTGNALNNQISGNSGNNTLSGGAGNDTLDGGVGADTLLGGAGDDTYYVDQTGDAVTEAAAEGTDTVVSAIDYTLGGNVENLTLSGYGNTSGTGNALNNRMVGNSADNTLDGGAGADAMLGGSGNDIYVVDSATDVVTENVNEGTDLVQSSVTYTLSANIERLTLTGTANINGTGNTLDNILTGNAGNNTLDGGAGADTMAGGLGNDIYIVDNAGDVATENLNEGTVDRVLSSVSYTIGANIEYLTLTGSAAIDGTGNELNNVLTGNGANNTITGGAGHDIVDGGAGADILIGGLGNETYKVDNSGDVVIENAGEGVDTVQSSVSYTLSANVEHLTLVGTTAINGIGNELGNALTGNSAANTLTGGAGNDVLNGAGGADTLIGGTGDDSYYVDNTGDVTTELAGEGSDTVYTSISWTLGDNLENLSINTTSAITVTGNALDNLMTAGAGNNTIDGGAGTDTANYAGASSAVTVSLATTAVQATGGSGTDTLLNIENLTGSAYNDSLTGNAGNNALNGGVGADTLAGGAGDDSYTVDNAGDVVAENANEGTDTVVSSLSYTLGANLENLTLTGSATNATGNALNNVLTGTSGNNLLDGGAGADTLVGGVGNDTYVVDDAGDVVTEGANAGTDLVQASVTYALSANVEHLVLTGTADLNGTGNSLNNGLTGNAGNNLLDGGAGNDSMAGGAGNDTYVVDSSSDVVTEAASAGTDTVQSSATYTLGVNVENLSLTGTAAINGTGNALDNVLIGNSAANTLNGSGGSDTLLGGAGNDFYLVDNVGDVVVELADEGTDLIQSSVSYTLGANVENLTLAGTALINATGNAADNLLTGNSSNNTLDGGVGADTMAGSAGNDTYVVDNVGDVVTEGLNAGTDLVQASVTYALSANVENLTLTGADAINGTGNALNNTLTGNAGNNVLDGGTGNDSMAGGAGNDTYVVDSTSDVVTEAASAGTDTVQSSATYTLGVNVENLTLTSAVAINGTGNTLDNLLTGNSAVNTLTGGAGNDTLDGGAGADVLVGGTGNDTYLLGRGYGIDTVTENDATAGNTDIAQFGAGIAVDQLWFSQSGNNLDVSILGTTDKLTISNWYLGSQYHVEQFKTSDGHTLLDSQVQNLVSAMAGFAPPAAGQTTLPANYASSLAPTLAANWQ